MRGGFSLGRIARIAVRVDWSVLVIFTLLVTSLALGYLPSVHPSWSPLVLWGTAFFAGLLFFASILAHELSHALVGRALGIPVDKITLFIFGGLAHMRGEPKKPSAELGMTIVGPLTSLLLGLLFTWIGISISGAAFDELVVRDPEAAMSALSPAATLLLWLGPVNVLLGIFNLIPGFPLDGGRVLRALIWAATKDFEKATRWATLIGRGFGYAFMALGVLMVLGWYVPFLGRGLIAGVWIIMIGWFLTNAARASYQQLVTKDLLADVPVTTLMTREFISVPKHLSISRFVESYVMHHDQRCFPVFDGERMIGQLCVEDVRAVPRDQWDQVTVGEVMVPADIPPLTAESSADEALETLSRRDVDQLPVVQDGFVLGLVRKKDILRWLTLHREFAEV